MLIAAIAFMFVLTAVGYIGLPLVHQRCVRLLLGRKTRRLHALVLTFDDGPGSRLTPAVLQTLAEHGTKATFFLLGRNIVGKEELVRRMAREGHEIGSHGYDHLHHWKVSPLRAIKDIKRGWQAIDAALGVSGGKYPFRPCRGKLNVITLAYLLVRRVPIVYWSADSRDTWRVRPEAENARTLVERGGAVVLMHDFDRSSDQTNRLVVDSARTALVTAQKMAIKTVTYSQLRHRRTVAGLLRAPADSTTPPS